MARLIESEQNCSDATVAVATEQKLRGLALQCRKLGVQQVGSYLGHSGRGADPFGKAVRVIRNGNPTPCWPELARAAALDGYGLYGGDISTAAVNRATGIIIPNTNTEIRNSASSPIG